MNGNGQASPASHAARLGYVNLVGRSYLQAVREVDRVKDAAQEEARRQNAGVLPARFQLSPLHQEQIRVITASFVNVLGMASEFEIETAEIEHIVHRLDEHLSRNSRGIGRVNPIVALPLPVVPNSTRQQNTSAGNGGAQSNVAESSARRNMPTPSVLQYASTTGPGLQQSAPLANPINYGDGVDTNSRTTSASNNRSSVASTISASPIQASQRPGTTSVTNTPVGNPDIRINTERPVSRTNAAPRVGATTSLQNRTGDTPQQMPSNNVNELNGGGNAVPQHSMSGSSGIVGRTLSGSTGSLPTQESSLLAILPQMSQLYQSTSLLPGESTSSVVPPPLPKSPPETSSPPISLLLSVRPAPSESTLPPRMSSPCLPNSTLSRPIAEVYTPSKSTSGSSTVSSAFTTIPTPSLLLMQRSVSQNGALPQGNQQELAKGSLAIRGTSNSAPPSGSASPPVTKSYKHSKLGSSNVRRVTVDLNGMVTGRPSGSSQFSEKAAGKQPLRPTLSSFDSYTHAQAQNAARSRILQAQQDMLAQATLSLDQTAEPAAQRIDAVARKASINEDASHTSKSSRTIYDVAGGGNVMGIPASTTTMTNDTAVPENRLSRIAGNSSGQAQRSPQSSANELSQATDRFHNIGPHATGEGITRNRENQKGTSSATLSETATLSASHNEEPKRSDTEVSNVATGALHALLPFKSVGPFVTITQIAEQVQAVARVGKSAAFAARKDYTVPREPPAIDDDPAEQTTPFGIQQSPVPSVNQTPSLRLRPPLRHARPVPIPPLPKWLIGQAQRKYGDSEISPLPVWAFLPEYDAPTATYASKRRRVHAPEPEWYKTAATSTLSHRLEQSSIDKSSDTAAPAGADSSMPISEIGLPASAGAVVVGAVERNPSERQGSMSEVQPPDTRPQKIASPTARSSNKVRRAEQAEENMTMDIDTSLDLSANLTSSPEEFPSESPFTPRSPVSRPVSSGAHRSSSQRDEDITMSDGTAEGNGTGSTTRSSSPACQLPTRKQSTPCQDEVLLILTFGSADAALLSSGPASSSTSQRENSVPSDLKSDRPHHTQIIIGARTKFSSPGPPKIVDKEVSIPHRVPIPHRWPEPAPSVVHAIPEQFTNKDIIKWQRKVWRTCFCEWRGCGAILNSWELLEKHILAAHVTLQRPRPNPNSHESSFVQPAAPIMSAFERSQLHNGRRPLSKTSISASRLGDQRPKTDEDEDPIALNPGTKSTRGTPIKLIFKAPGPRNGIADYREPPASQPEKVWLPYVCLYGECAYKEAASTAYVNTDALKRHCQKMHLDVKQNSGFPCCVVKDCPNCFSEAFEKITLSHKHIRAKHAPAALANMQFAQDMPNIIPTSALVPLPKKAPEYVTIDPPVRNGPKAPPEALIHALADTQDSWDSQADMTFRTAFGFVPVSHSETALEGAPIPPYDMYAQGTPSDTRSLFNPVPEYTLCTPRHPASHKSWKRLPVKMELAPKRRHEKIVTPWCNLSELSRRDDAKIKLIMTRDPEKAIQEQKKKGPRKVALEDPEKVPVGMEREWPMRETIGPWHYLEDVP
ncbi:hypothetical protein QFC21_001986 [Naganishia friedmannii]|uniref:Uncharacterized protein n=1 Tax=Naganishia friedmannii TaxID=89922 RepID=A0ACC2W053_9TREE|nr:hypothetical protein QFC21_001986 [Naganishia friedmannii]